MIRVFNVYLPHRTLLLAVSETLLVFSVLLATVVGLGEESAAILRHGNGFKIALASVVCLLCMYYYDLYDSAVFTNAREVLTRLIQVLGTVCVILALLYRIYPAVGLDVGIFLTGIVLVGLCLVGWRRLFVVLNQSPRLAERAVVLGEGALAASLAREIENHPEIGVRVVGFLGKELSPGAAMNVLPRIGTVEELSLIESKQIKRVIIAMSDRRGSLPVEALLQLKTRGVLIQDGADVYEAVTGKVPLDSLRLSWLLFSPGFRVSPAMRAYKRACSVVLSLPSLLVALPVMGLIALAVWLDSGGPIIFRQKRPGQNRKLFTLYKFRSMRNGLDREASALPASENDDRFTRVGRWLRRLRLDELPQLYNILRGDMYFIGPRPFPVEQEEKWVRLIPFYSQRWSVRPGATGWAQVHRGYCESLEDNAEKLAYDLFYIKNLSVGLDILVAFQTIKILLLGRGGR